MSDAKKVTSAFESLAEEFTLLGRATEAASSLFEDLNEALKRIEEAATREGKPPVILVSPQLAERIEAMEAKRAEIERAAKRIDPDNWVARRDRIARRIFGRRKQKSHGDGGWFNDGRGG